MTHQSFGLRPILFFFAALALLQPGCRSEHIATYAPMPAAESLHRMTDRAASIRTISSQGLITLTKENGDTVRLDAAIVLQPPDHARLRAWKFGRAVFDMTLTPQGLWLIAPTDEARRKEILAAGANTGKLVRQWLQIMTGAFDAASLKISESEKLLTIEQSRDDGTLMICTIDRKTLTARRYVLKDQAGKTRFTLSLGSYAEVNGVVWPRDIDARSDAGRIVIELHDIEINTELPPAAFRHPARAEKISELLP
jgi:outer membrane lipoprotein-sorting protein